MPETIERIALAEATRERYLSYALSVITARALPDARDGLKPVQRRILYAMFAVMGLRPGGRYRKSAAVVGEVMGKFHPHGDQSIYDALVRMAQDFTLRAPLVDGQGNFGSLDGDPPAAMRYTECRLRPLAEELLTEIKRDTVPFRPNYDGQLLEPVVLPAQFPQLLVNGCEGIAVGMATRIPPHNLAEVAAAARRLIADRALTVADLLGSIRGPDFPTGGRLLTPPDDLLTIYEEGRGSLRLRAEFHVEKHGRRSWLVLDSLPYGQNKSRVLEAIGAEVQGRNLPQVHDLRDESTEGVRIVLELKSGASPELVMAYLCKHTGVEATWPVNLTALFPSPKEALATPERSDLRGLLLCWLDFRFATVRRRFEFDRQKLLARIHLLEGLARIFDRLDEAIRIIRESEGKAEASRALREGFGLSEEQAEAVLELKLYRLARLEIGQVREELEEKRAEEARIGAILASDAELWKVVDAELDELARLYGEPRRTKLGGARALSYEEEAYIVQEDCYCVVTRRGWLKRQSSFSELSRIRLRDEDEIGWLIQAHTRSSLVFFSSHGAAYVMRVDDVPSTTGYGEPLQRFFAFADGETVVGVQSFDSRRLPGGGEAEALALTRKGRAIRFKLAGHAEPSTRNGRRYARLAKGDRVVGVERLEAGMRACVGTKLARALVFPADDVTLLKAAGKGNLGIKLRSDDAVLAFGLAAKPDEGPEVVTARGRHLVISEARFGLRKRASRGRPVLKRDGFVRWVREPMVAVDAPDAKAVEASEAADAAEETSQEVPDAPAGAEPPGAEADAAEAADEKPGEAPDALTGADAPEAPGAAEVDGD